MSGERVAVRRAPRIGCWSGALALGVAVVRLLESVVGDRVTAGLLALAVVGGAVQAWAVYVEPRLFGSTRPPDEVVVVSRRAVAELDHVDFARALSAVADAYLNECQRRAGLDDEGGLR